jgi:hypothetical protein
MKLSKLAVIATLGLATTPARAEDNTFVAQVWSQVVTFAAPERFQLAHRSLQGPDFLIELVPNHQTVQSWGEMITMTGHEGASGDAGRMASNLIALYGQSCPDSFATHDLAPPKLDGARAAAAAYVGCGDLGGYSEAMVFVAIDGAKDLYSLQWAVRGKASAGPLKFDAKQWKARLAQFRGARFSQ